MNEYGIRKSKDGTMAVVYKRDPETGKEIRPKIAPTRAEWDRLRKIDPWATAPTPSPRQPITVWRPVGSPPLGDADAASRVTPKPETRPANQQPIPNSGFAIAPNQYKPNDTELAAFRNSRDRYARTAIEYDPAAKYVTGAFTGTTDEIIQWACHKWGIPEDIGRAVCCNESWWRQWPALGDHSTDTDASKAPSFARTGDRSAYLSLGITQIKFQPETYTSGTGVEPLRWKSTAFNLDLWGKRLRYYFDGKCYWCNDPEGRTLDYKAGDGWLTVGAHYNPSPWGNAGQYTYIDQIKKHIADRTWESPDFR